MNSPQHSPLDDLATKVLLDIADDAEREELARLVAASPESRRRFLDNAMLHGMLVREARAGSFAPSKGEFFRNLENAPARGARRLRHLLLPAAALVIISFLLLFLLPMKANAALDRVIDVMSQARDRTYRIEVIEAPQEPRDSSRPDRGRFPVGNFLDGAALWMRGPHEFVLSQDLPNGQKRLIGADGKESWSMRGGEEVRVSPDPARFGRAIFAKNGEIAFLDLRTQLEELKRLYQIEWLDRTSSVSHKLIATRRSADQGGAREIELWFHPQTGVLEKMILRQLPRGNGGPHSIAITLVSTEALPADFFRHQHHHEPDRTVLPEP